MIDSAPTGMFQEIRGAWETVYSKTDVLLKLFKTEIERYLDNKCEFLKEHFTEDEDVNKCGSPLWEGALAFVSGLVWN